MNLKELSLTLPNGFHDAELLEMNVNFIKNSASLRMNLWVGDLQAVKNPKESYQEVILQLSAVDLFSIERPNNPDKYIWKGSWVIDSFETTEKQFPGLENFPEKIKTNLFSFYSDSTNSFIHISAKEVVMNTIGEVKISE